MEIPMARQIAVGLIVIVLLAPALSHGARFVALGQAAGAANANSTVWGVSADGTVVTGTIGGEQGAFRWTQHSGMVVLGDA
jgi:probable HAF family extracellular repeat protein